MRRDERGSKKKWKEVEKGSGERGKERKTWRREEKEKRGENRERKRDGGGVTWYSVVGWFLRSIPMYSSFFSLVIFVYEAGNTAPSVG